MIFLCGLCISVSAQRFDFTSRVGVVDVNEDGKRCLIIPNPGLMNGTSISLIVLSNRQSVEKTIIKEKLGVSCSRNPDTGNASFYLLQSLQSRSFKIKERQAAAIAIVSSGPIQIQNGRATVDLDNDGHREFFRECTSNEGVHLTVWSGKPLQGRRRWHFYYYLGYDVMPSCKRKDYM